MNWISLDEQFPEKDVWILGWPAIEVLRLGDPKIPSVKDEKAWLDRYGASTSIDSETVTHWMYFPDDPKDGAKYLKENLRNKYE
jgi:hypothetical protein